MMRVIRILVDRLSHAVRKRPSRSDIALTLRVAGGFAFGSLCIGLPTGFLEFQPVSSSVTEVTTTAVKLFIMPSLVEEAIFRVGLTPSPSVRQVSGVRGALPVRLAAVTAYVLYHPFQAWTYYPEGASVFLHPSFLALATTLGVACDFLYTRTASLWCPTLLHWSVVSVWLLLLGGKNKFQEKS